MDFSSENKLELILVITVLLIIIFALVMALYSTDDTELTQNDLLFIEQNCRAFCNTYSGMGYDHINELGECLCWKDTLTIYGNHSYVTNRTQNYGIVNAFYQKS